MIFKPEANKEVRAKANALPSEEEEEEVISHNEDEHGKAKKIDISKEEMESGVTFHIADRVDVDQKADSGNNIDHNGGERIDDEVKRDLE